jgi:hypothetical protein
LDQPDHLHERLEICNGKEWKESKYLLDTTLSKRFGCCFRVSVRNNKRKERRRIHEQKAGEKL